MALDEIKNALASDGALAFDRIQRLRHRYLEDAMRGVFWAPSGLFIAAALAGCQTPTTPRYSVSANNGAAIKAIKASGIAVGEFAAPADFSPDCRGVGPLQVADGLTHTQYIRKAFEDEFKTAGIAETAGRPSVLLTGRVTRLEFSSTSPSMGASWTIDLTLRSSNGKSMSISEYYEFSSGMPAQEACRSTAEAFSRAVQNLVGKAVRAQAFPSLLLGSSASHVPEPEQRSRGHHVPTFTYVGT